MQDIFDKFTRNDSYNQHICYKFRELYQDYRISPHCRASKTIADNIENYFIKTINNNIDSLENKNFKELFNIVKKIVLVPAKDGGGKVIRTKQGGACGISVLGCYDITICLVKSIPSCRGPNKIILIKDNTKGPWNYVTQILKLTPKKIDQNWCEPFTLYYIEKKEIINSEKNEQKLFKITNSNCNDIESYLCKFWHNHNNQ